MTQPKATRPCPIPGCTNRTWAARQLDVCGECAHHIAHVVRGPIESNRAAHSIEVAGLRQIIARQTRDIRALRDSPEDDPRTEAEEPRTATTDGVVYYLRVGSYIKIGWSSDIEKRMRAYPPDSILLATEPGTRKDEANRHRMFAVHRTHGREWYAMTPSVMHHIDRVVSAQGVPDTATFAARPVDIPQPRQAERIRPRGWSGKAS